MSKQIENRVERRCGESCCCEVCHAFVSLLFFVADFASTHVGLDVAPTYCTHADQDFVDLLNFHSDEVVHDQGLHMFDLTSIK